MTFRINLTKIKIILLFIISGLPGCCLFIGNLKLRLSLILTIAFIIFYLLFSYKSFFKEIINCLKSKCSKILLLWLSCCFISGLSACIFGTYNMGKFLYYFVFHGILLVLLPYFLAFDIAGKIPVNKLIKYYFVFLTVIFALGLLNMFFLYSGVDFLQTLFDYTLVNTRQSSIYSVLMRTKSTFVEPSFFANFICINLPLIYEFSKSKCKIFNSFLINFLVKKCFIVISWLLLVMTFSPIFLLFGCILTFIYCALTINIKKLFKKQIIPCVLILCIMFIVGILVLADNKIDITETYLKRIIEVLSSLKSVDAIIFADQSLGTRIVSIVNQFILFLKHPVLGVGYGNIIPTLAQQLYNSPLPLTYELAYNLQLGVDNANLFIAWTTLAETGLTGFILLYLFIFNCIKKTKVLIKYTISNEQKFFKAMYWGCCFFTIVSFYDGEFAGFILMLLGFIAGQKLITTKNKGENYAQSVD